MTINARSIWTSCKSQYSYHIVSLFGLIDYRKFQIEKSKHINITVVRFFKTLLWMFKLVWYVYLMLSLRSQECTVSSFYSFFFLIISLCFHLKILYFKTLFPYNVIKDAVNATTFIDDGKSGALERLKQRTLISWISS